MSTLALIAAAPLALVQSGGTIVQAPVVQAPAAQSTVVQAQLAQAPAVQAPVALSPVVQSPVAPSPVAQPLAKAERVELMPQVAFAQPPAGPAPEFRIAAQGTPVAPAQSPMAQPIVMTYRLAANDAELQGPPAPGPTEEDIAWANGVTAQHRAEVARQGWHKIVPYEIAWQALNALDLAQTLDCTHRFPTCKEANPILGHRPSDGLVIGVKGGMAIAHFLLMRHIAHRDWKAARWGEIGTILVQGVIDGLNFRYAFK